MKKSILLLLLTIFVGVTTVQANPKHNHKNGSFLEVMGDFVWRVIHNDVPDDGKYASQYKTEKPWYLKWLD